MSAVVQIKIAIPPRFLPELEAAAAASAVTPPELVGRVVTVPLSAFGSLPAGGKHAAHRLAAAERLIGRAAASSSGRNRGGIAILI